MPSIEQLNWTSNLGNDDDVTLLATKVYKLKYQV
jgi:hypothetical protein